MRKSIIILIALLGVGWVVWNLHTVLLQLPDDADQGPVYRIMFFHIPAWFSAGIAVFIALGSSIGYLITKNLKYDAVALATTEAAVAFLTIGLVTGSIWGRISWGIWWTWDARLTSALVCWLLYAGYLVLRTAIEEPSQRARISAVLQIFAFADIPIVWYSIEWFRTQHPGPVLRGSGEMDGAMKAAVYANWPALMLVAAAFVLLRLRQEEVKREIDSLRRIVHAG
ncbi:MAG: cytochrome c biogenesis protein CcsA [Bryobacterales bacterium]|jgi:heme exporter protein C|nr:cytochrome c biogenesis protein CcsA [Bryobacterales bacterium]